MALFEWTDELSVGIASIDDQHKRLVTIVNDLHDAMLRREGRQALATTFVELADYMDEHFAHEESLLESHDYPEVETHRTQHAEIAHKVEELRHQFEEGRATITVEVMEFLRDWFRSHIVVSDRRYVRFLLDKGAS